MSDAGKLGLDDLVEKLVQQAIGQAEKKLSSAAEKQNPPPSACGESEVLAKRGRRNPDR